MESSQTLLHVLNREAVTLAANEQNDHFPLWGTCMGLQTLLVLTSDPDVLSSDAFDSEGLMLPLEISPAGEKSRLIEAMPAEVKKRGLVIIASQGYRL